MPCQVLDRFGIHSGVDQVRDIRVAQQVRCYREIYGINDITTLLCTLPYKLLYASSLRHANCTPFLLNYHENGI